MLYHENVIVRSRVHDRNDKSKGYHDESNQVPWPMTLKLEPLPMTTRLGKGYGPPMWLVITEPSGDTVECLIDRFGSGKCTKVRRIKAKDNAAINIKNNVGSPVVSDDDTENETEPDCGGRS